MKDQKDLNTELMFEQACAFVDCAEFTENQSSKIELRTHSHMYANLALSALACEIFLKCLIVKNGGKYGKDHDLAKLWKKYKKLDVQKAKEISDGIDNWFNSSDPDFFDKMIKDASNAFVEWRYIFDNDKIIRINPQFLRGFRCAIRTVCCQQIHGQSWEEYVSGL